MIGSGSARGEYARAPRSQTISDVLRAAADALDVDLATWAARDPADLSTEARDAHRAALSTLGALSVVVGRVRDELERARPDARARPDRL